MEYETAGDPVTGSKWTRKTTEKIAGRTSRDTAEFAVDTIRTWWLKVAFCDRLGLKLRLCHYPPDASKWNPIVESIPRESRMELLHSSLRNVKLFLRGPLSHSGSMK